MNPIITIDEVKQYLNISGREADDFLENAIDMVSQEIEGYTQGHVFALRSITGEIHSGDGTNILVPKYEPLYSLVDTTEATKLSSVQYKLTPDSSWTDIETLSAHIFLRPLWIELYDEIFPKGTNNIKLNYSAGYAAIPGDVRKVCIEWVSKMYDESSKGRGNLGIDSKSAQNTTNVTFRDMLPQWQAVLDRYKVFAV